MNKKIATVDLAAARKSRLLAEKLVAAITFFINTVLPISALPLFLQGFQTFFDAGLAGGNGLIRHRIKSLLGFAMKLGWKTWPMMATLIFGLNASLAWADHHEESAGSHDKANKGTQTDKPDAYTVEDSRDKTLTNAKKPVRKLDHKLKHKGDKPVDPAMPSSDEATGVNPAGSPK